MFNMVVVIVLTLVQTALLLLSWSGFYLLKDSLLFINTGAVFVPIFCLFPCVCFIKWNLNNGIDWGNWFCSFLRFLFFTFGCYVLSGVPSFLAFLEIYL